MFDLFANLKRSSWRRQSQAQNQGGQNQQAQKQNPKEGQNQNQRNSQDTNRSSTSTPTNSKQDGQTPPPKNPWNNQKQNKSFGTGGGVVAAAPAAEKNAAVTAPTAQQQQSKPDPPAQPPPQVEQFLIDDFNAQEARDRLKRKHQALLSANGGKIERYQPPKEEGEKERAKGGPWGNVPKRKTYDLGAARELTDFVATKTGFMANGQSFWEELRKGFKGVKVQGGET